MRNSVLPTSSVEMKTDRFSSYAHYAKAALVFAATTAAYFLAKTTGVLPGWFWGGSIPSGSEPMDKALTLPESSGLIIQEVQPEFAVFSRREELAETSGVWASDGEPSLTDFKETGFMKSRRQHLLQQTPAVAVVNRILDQVISIGQPYSYSLSRVFSGNYSVLGAVETGQSSLPDWLSLEYTLLGNYPAGSGSAQDVAVSGNTAFVASGAAGLQIVDVSVPGVPRLLGGYPAGSGSALGVVVSGSTAFVANQDVLLILDVSMPGAPRLLGNYSAGSGQVNGVAVSGDTVFLANGNALQIVDVSTLSAPRLLGSYPAGSGYTHGVAVSGSTVFVANDDAVLILDVSTPSAPSLLGSRSVAFLGSAYGVAVSGSTVFVANGNDLLIMDVSTPSAPSLLSLYPAGSGQVNGVAVSGSTVFLADETGGLLVVDADNLTAPRLLGSYPAGLSGTAFGVAVSGSTVFLADGPAGLLMIDVSQGQLIGAPPNQLGQQSAITVSARNVTTALATDVFTLTLDSLPYLVQTSVSDQSVFPFPENPLSLRLSSRLFVNPSNSFLRLSVQSKDPAGLPWLTLAASPPIAVGRYVAGSGNDALGVAVSGSTAFVANGNVLLIVDVSTPSAPRLLSSYPSPGPFGGAIYGIAVSGTRVFMVDGASGILMLDVSTPSVPRLLGSYSAGLGVVSGIAISDSKVFMVDKTAGLLILDVSTPSAPHVLGNYSEASGVASGVAVFGSTVFVAAGKLWVLDVSTPATPLLLGNYTDSSGYAYDVVVSGTIVFVAYGKAGLLILDVSTPSMPRLLSNYSAGLGTAYGLAVSGTTVFVANGNALLILDVSIPTIPRLMGSYPMDSGFARNVAVSGSAVFVANDDALLIVDVSQWTFIAAPTVADVKNYQLSLIATDAFGGTASTPFSLRVEGPPQINGTIAQQYAKVGQAFSYFVPQGLITDPNFDPISFSATVQGRSSLPAWLSFNGVSAIFVGVPQDDDVGNWTIILSATDHIAGVLNTTFSLLVDHLPVVKQSISPQVSGIGLSYDYTVPDTVFFEPESYPLFYTAQQSNRSPLPHWLTFNETSRQFSGQPNSTDAGSYSITVIARDDYQGQAKVDFVLVVENFPVVNQQLTAPLAGVGIPFNWAIPSNTFIDQDNDFLTYTARQQDGLLLPNWLSFNPQTLIFSGIPLSTDARTLALQLSVVDPAGGRAQQNVNLTVTYFPQKKRNISAQLADVDHLYQYTLPADAFSQEDNAVLLYSVQQSSGSPLPDWLSFNNRSLQLRGTPNSTVMGDYSLQVVASNSHGAQAKIDFFLTVEHFPEVLQPITPSLANINEAFNFLVPQNSFLDRDNEPLTYTPQRKNGGSLPNWLSFNPQSGVFSGFPLETDQGSLPLQVIATDSAGAWVASDITIQVVHFPVVAHPPSPKTLRAGQLFDFSLAPDTFVDIDQAGLSYSIGPVLPGWVTFDNRTLRFSGQASNEIGSTSFTVVATDTRGAPAGLEFKLVVRGDVPPTVLASFLSNQPAKVSQAFSYFPPNPLFLDPNNNTLRYSAFQQDGSPLPDWLRFDNESLHFWGTPGHGDTNFYTTRVLSVSVMAQSDEGQASARFNINVDGMSWGELAVNIGAPIISFFTTLYALYEYRAVLLNRLNRNKYTRLESKQNNTVIVGETFEYALKDEVKSQIRRIETRIPAEKVEGKGCCRFFKADSRPLPGGEQLPSWMEYHEDKNVLRSKGKVPKDIFYRQLVIQVEGEAGVILEKFTLKIIDPAEPSLEVEGHEQKSLLRESKSLDFVERGDKSRKQSVIEMESLKEITSPGRDSLLSPIRSPQSSQSSMIPRPSTAASDSPLMSGARTLHRLMVETTDENSTITRGSEREVDNNNTAARSCC